jgi:medium-chain acyl-[acyl-carrier-protein] hydrolase
MAKTNCNWFQTGPARENVALKIFCFPYAGGSALVFKKWADLLPSNIQVIPVELPGRGARMQEAPFVSLPDLVDNLGEVIGPLLDRPFALFGHSMGAIIAFELARALRQKYDVEPRALFVAGRRAPNIPNSEPITYNLPKDEFMKELIELDGTPREVLEHEELMEMIIPLLRADFQLIQTYQYSAGPPLQCPIIAYGGLQDRHVTRETLMFWKEHTSSRFSLSMLPGDHFFLRSSQVQLLGLMARELHGAMARSGAGNA